jgi:hypothetical protein
MGYLRSWRSGPHQGKAAAAVQSILARGLVEIPALPPGWRALFTETSQTAPRQKISSWRRTSSAVPLEGSARIGHHIPGDR